MRQSMAIHVQLLMELQRYSRGDLRGVKDALAAGASVDGARNQPFSPLMMAATCSEPSMIKFLVQRGADLEAGKPSDADYADGRPMLKKGARAVHCAVHCCKVDNLMTLCELGANPDAIDSIGRTPLMAVFLDEVEDGDFRPKSALMSVLLRAGADIELAAHDGTTALHLAAGMGAPYEMLCRLASDAMPYLPDNNSHTPLYYAAFEGHAGTVSSLLAMGARDDVDLVLENNDADISSLLTAVSRGHGSVVRTILDKGIEAVGGIGVIPVAIVTAINGRQVRLLQMLLADARFQEALGMYRYEKTATTIDCMNVLLSHVGKDRRKEAEAIRRVLKRAPACWARSWAWPTGVGVAGTSGASVPAKPPLGVYVVRRPKNEAFFAVRLAR